jgi:hypothetical protein
VTKVAVAQVVTKVAVAQVVTKAAVAQVVTKAAVAQVMTKAAVAQVVTKVAVAQVVTKVGAQANDYNVVFSWIFSFFSPPNSTNDIILIAIVPKLVKSNHIFS